MKRFPLIIALLLVAAVAFAGTYSITTTTAQDNRLERHRIRVNKATCAGIGLPANCTQAQARQYSQVNIYSSVQDMIERLIVKNFTDGLKQQDTSDDQAQFCTWFAGATQAQRNQTCALAGLPNGCEACQIP